MPENIILIYDDECPFCARYARYLRLKETIGALTLINARDSEHDIVKQVIEKGLDLNEGMVAIIDGHYYHGDKALHILASISTPSTLFNKFNYYLFRSPKRSKICYPFLRAGRNFVLKLKRINPIDHY